MADYFDHVDAAMDTARRAAVSQAVTFIDGTITGVGASGVNVLLGDGTTVPTVPVLAPYVPYVGDVVRVAVQGSSLLVVGALAIPQAKVLQYQTSSTFSITATAAFQAMSTPARVLATVPRSGVLAVHLKARLTPTATARAMASVRVTDALGTTLAQYGNPLLEVPAGAGTYSMGGTYLFPGLTPGDKVYAEAVGLSGLAGQTVQIGYIVLVAQPTA